MLDAKRFGTPLKPILAHSLVHTVLMFIVLLFYTSSIYDAFVVGALQLVTHFLIDVLKGKMNVWYPTLQSPYNKLHWYIFGLDQLLHQMVLIISVYQIS